VVLNRNNCRSEFREADRQAILLLSRLLDTWHLLPKAEVILKDAMLYLWDREGYRRLGGRRWRITEVDFYVAQAVTRPKF
jgi:hypothetical protein